MKLKSAIIKAFRPLSLLLLSSPMLLSCQKQESSLEARFPDKFEGKTVEMVSFRDSAVLQTGVVKDGRILFDNTSLLGDDLSTERAERALRAILAGGAGRERMLADFAELRTVIGGAGASDRFAQRMVEELRATK